MPIVSAHVRPDGTILPEGEAGVAVAGQLREIPVLDGGTKEVWIATTRTQLPAGWSVTPDLVEGGYRILSADLPELEDPSVRPEYSVVNGELVRATAPAPPPVLRRAQLNGFVRRAGLGQLYAAAVAAAGQPAAAELARRAVDELTDGDTFTFEGTLRNAGAALTLLPAEALQGVTIPDFSDPATVAGYLEHWWAAYNQPMPTQG